jgi:hypothetical protein
MEPTVLAWQASPAFNPTPDGWLTFDNTTGALTGTPQSTDVGLLDVSITVSDDGSPPLSDTLSFTLDVREGSSITISWNAVVTRVNGDPIADGELDHYEVSYQESGDPSPTLVSVDPTQTSFTTPRLPGGTYTVKVKAVDFWSLDSGYTASQTATIL